MSLNNPPYVQDQLRADACTRLDVQKKTNNTAKKKKADLRSFDALIHALGHIDWVPILSLSIQYLELHHVKNSFNLLSLNTT